MLRRVRRWYNTLSGLTGWLGKILILLGVALAALQVLHMMLLDRLDTQLNPGKPLHRLQKDISITLPIVKQTIETNYKMDSSGEYRIVYDVFKSNVSVRVDELETRYGVILVSQCSLNHLHHVVDLTQYWHGPLSVAVFVPHQYINIVVESLVVLHYCIPHMRTNISVHLVYTLTPNPIEVAGLAEVPEIVNCDNFHKVLDRVLQDQLKPVQNYDHGREKYPNNLLRNVAARYAQTDYVLVTDIDIVPSRNLYKQFKEFARHSAFSSESASLDSLTAYVLPVFELQQGTELPGDKPELLHLWDQGSLRPFYFELCWKCQKPTEYGTWRNLSRSDGLSARYELEWKDPWEPFYITPRLTMPPYDERFKQFGFNRISQVCEAHISGFKFAVLDNAFLIHKGFKTQEGFHHSKDSEQEQNRMLFRTFKEELKTKYPDSTRRCY